MCMFSFLTLGVWFPPPSEQDPEISTKHSETISMSGLGKLPSQQAELFPTHNTHSSTSRLNCFCRFPRNSPIICLLRPFLCSRKWATPTGVSGTKPRSIRYWTPFSGFLRGNDNAELLIFFHWTCRHLIKTWQQSCQSLLTNIESLWLEKIFKTIESNHRCLWPWTGSFGDW